VFEGTTSTGDGGVIVIEDGDVDFVGRLDGSAFGVIMLSSSE
jgi:hypothetical protein